MTKTQIFVHFKAMMFNFKMVDKKFCDYFIYIYFKTAMF